MRPGDGGVDGEATPTSPSTEPISAAPAPFLVGVSPPSSRSTSPLHSTHLCSAGASQNNSGESVGDDGVSAPAALGPADLGGQAAPAAAASASASASAHSPSHAAHPRDGPTGRVDGASEVGDGGVRRSAVPKSDDVAGDVAASMTSASRASHTGAHVQQTLLQQLLQAYSKPRSGVSQQSVAEASSLLDVSCHCLVVGESRVASGSDDAQQLASALALKPQQSLELQDLVTQWIFQPRNLRAANLCVAYTTSRAPRLLQHLNFHTHDGLAGGSTGSCSLPRALQRFVCRRSGLGWTEALRPASTPAP